MSRRALRRVPRGTTLGIVRGPEGLPDRRLLVSGPWTICSSATGRSSLHIGRRVANGQVVDGDHGFLVRSPTNDAFLVWHGHRHRVSPFALGALAWRFSTPAPIATAVLAGIPRGADLDAIPIPGRGSRSRAAFATVGQVFVVRPEGAPEQYAVAVAAGLAPISQVQANLLLAEERLAAQGAPEALPLAVYAAAPMAPSLLTAVPTLAPPATMPTLLALTSMDAAICVAVINSQQQPTITVKHPSPDVDTPVNVTTVPGENGIDQIVVPPAAGAVIESMGSPWAASGTLGLVTETGCWYPISDSRALAILGYSDVTPVRLPASLVAGLPQGPVLDPDLARRPATGASYRPQG